MLAESGRTIIDVAELIGVKYSHLAKSLGGQVTPSKRVRDLLPIVLGVPLEELYTADVLARQYTGPRPGNTTRGPRAGRPRKSGGAK